MQTNIHYYEEIQYNKAILSQDKYVFVRAFCRQKRVNPLYRDTAFVSTKLQTDICNFDIRWN